MKRLVLALLMALVLILTFSGACAPEEKYPSKPITMIDPWDPGGLVDIIGRIMASGAGDYIGRCNPR